MVVQAGQGILNEECVVKKWPGRIGPARLRPPLKEDYHVSYSNPVRMKTGRPLNRARPLSFSGSIIQFPNSERQRFFISVLILHCST